MSRSATESGRVAAQRFKESGFNRPIKKAPIDNAKANQKALRNMSLLELQCGITPEQYAEFHRVQRERVRKRWLAA